jgi:menaquinone-dependent protoporphyrinogen IX oxidase
MMEDNEKNRNETLGWLEKTTNKYPDIHPLSVGLFGGAVVDDSEEYKKQSFVIKKIVNSMKEKMIEDYEKSDFRDFSKVKEWAQDLALQVPK